ncbi:hypothetical protein [Streptomyces hainanensis]|uniref:Uncharacterized protein n=1 Tax=Streptomyces hainanensis TaxID=402648 RepID=A0A4R4T8J0_9ACTN|nr:hypothetical protein [Streptomyces hainanensis]TDC73548.1 hypothetical protein E1283_18890 [Streptomyces hainanensis]
MSADLDVKDPRLQRLNALRLMIRDCVLEDGYRFPARFAEAVVLSETGREWFDHVMATVPDLSPGDAKAAVFAEFVVGRDLTFSLAETDFELARQVIGEEVRNRRIHYPWVFGRALDDAYIRFYGNTPQSYLGHSESLELLRTVPQGVFQVADVTVGPLGMLLVPEYRSLPPTTCGPAIECLDPGCVTVHHSRLMTGDTPSGDAYREIIPQVAVDMALARRVMDLYLPDDEHLRTDNRWGLPWLLTNGLSEAERRTLLVSLLGDNTDGVREFVGRHLGRELADQPATRIAETVDGPVLFQLLLTVTDGSLVLKLEEAIADGRIHVARTETRRPIRSKHENGGYFGSECQASRLGVRFVPRNVEVAPVALKHLITSLYAGDAREDLDWRLRTVPGNDAMTRLDGYLRTTPPREVIARLILDDRALLLAAFRELRYGMFRLPRTPDEESELIDRMLWKLGYPQDTPDSPDTAVRQFGAQLTGLLLTSTGPSSPVDRAEDVRSVGINLFTALERLLTSTLRFVCWALLSDPYPDERNRRFVFRRSWADRSLAETMSDPAGVPVGFDYDPAGRNSLGVLIQAFRVLATKCEQVLEREGDFVRDEARVPFFAARASSVYTFPFLHTRLVLDLSHDSRQSLLAALRNFASALETGRVVEVRNSLVHDGDDFPTAARIRDACAMVGKGLDILVEHGLLPTIYTCVGQSVDTYRRKVMLMTDGAGHTVQLGSPSELDQCELPPYERPQIILTGARLALTGEPMRMRYEEETEFTRMWDDYLARASRAGDIQDLHPE